MAIEVFWPNLLRAVNRFGLSVREGSTPLDTESQDRMLRDAATWLTPESVEGFDPNDFGFLPDEQQKALRESVERFRTVACQVSENTPATQAQFEEGRSAFGEIRRILQYGIRWDVEAFRSQMLLERELQGRLPSWVTVLSSEIFTDTIGDPAVWICIDVTDEAVDDGKIEDQWHALSERVEDAYRRVGGKRWPYIRFRSPDAFARSQPVSK